MKNPADDIDDLGDRCSSEAKRNNSNVNLISSLPDSFSNVFSPGQ